MGDPDLPQHSHVMSMLAYVCVHSCTCTRLVQMDGVNLEGSRIMCEMAKEGRSGGGDGPRGDFP